MVMERTLFDILDEEDAKAEVAAGKECLHPVSAHRLTYSIWPGETCVRQTAACELCGYVRGRWPGEKGIEDLTVRVLPAITVQK